jgi:transcriptional regulator with XRE-family HTH domain
MAAPPLERTPGRQDLGAFLKSRRARLSPEAVGLPPGLRRRTQGLRREELAQLAGVSVTWYTWLEQGRDIRVSTALLESLARVLRLDGTERAHLFVLARQQMPLPAASQASPLTPALQRLLDSLSSPAFIKTARWDVVAWNGAATRVFGDFAQLPDAERNLLKLMFLSPHYRRITVNWAESAQRILARFRIDHGRAAGDPAFEDLVAELRAKSIEFRSWWPKQDVLGLGEGIKRLRHPTAGVIEFEHTTFVIEGKSDLRMVVHAPLPGASAAAFDRLTAAPREEAVSRNTSIRTGLVGAAAKRHFRGANQRVRNE